MRQPNNLQVLYVTDVVDDAVTSVHDMIGLNKSLVKVLLNYDGKDTNDYDKIVATLSSLGLYFKNSPKV